MNIYTNHSLLAYNTLAVDVSAAQFVEVTDEQALIEAVAYAQRCGLEMLVLGGGSNIVLKNNYPGLVIKLNNRGIRVQNRGQERYVSCSAGENWHEFILYCLENHYYGMENLALIPGSVGAAPIQNIGAYGVEVKEYISSVRAWDVSNQQWRELSNADCQFGYRDSIFKQVLRDQLIITEVNFRFNAVFSQQLAYPALSAYLAESHRQNPGPYDIVEAVIAIRSAKLPNPKQTPNVGSFFKNPIISAHQLSNLQHSYPDIVYYPQASGDVKLAAGWLIDRAGWKGKTIGKVGVHDKQALVLINRGGTGNDIVELAGLIQKDIEEKFAVVLEIEPRCY